MMFLPDHMFVCEISTMRTLALTPCMCFGYFLFIIFYNENCDIDLSLLVDYFSVSTVIWCDFDLSMFVRYFSMSTVIRCDFDLLFLVRYFSVNTVIRCVLISHCLLVIFQ